MTVNTTTVETIVQYCQLLPDGTQVSVSTSDGTTIVGELQRRFTPERRFLDHHTADGEIGAGDDFERVQEEATTSFAKDDLVFGVTIGESDWVDSPCPTLWVLDDSTHTSTIFDIGQVVELEAAQDLIDVPKNVLEDALHLQRLGLSIRPAYVCALRADGAGSEEIATTLDVPESVVKADLCRAAEISGKMLPRNTPANGEV